jgi:hypothetical protein
MVLMSTGVGNVSVDVHFLIFVMPSVATAGQPFAEAPRMATVIVTNRADADNVSDAGPVAELAGA